MTEQERKELIESIIDDIMRLRLDVPVSKQDTK